MSRPSWATGARTGNCWRRSRSCRAGRTIIERQLAAAAPRSPEARELRSHLEQDRAFLAQKLSVRHTLPDLTFTDSLTIHLGEREIRVLHHDRAVTPGDAFLYLPNERVVVTGDLLVNPIPFALGCYPSGWLATLERIDALDAAVIVPGHGDPLRDKTLIETHLALFRALLREGRQAKERGLDVEQARAAALTAVHDLMVHLTGDDAARNQTFSLYAVDWFLHRVYDELDGRLTDDIAPIPRH